jgi:hypothetical protein
MNWIKTTDALPPTGSLVKARLRHCHTKNVHEHYLVKVDEDDVDWRTADSKSEVAYDWDIIEWESL